MKKFSKKFIAFLLIMAIVLSCTVVFANETDKDQPQYKYSDYIKSIAKNISLFGRYDDLIENNLYLTALDAIIEEHPELYETAVKAMVESVDENSAYYNKEEAKKYIESLDDEVVGIGVSVLYQDGNIVVSQPIPGSPAEKAGIKAGDIIIAADGIDLTDMVLDTAIEYIRGKEGTTVTITVIRSGLDAPIKFTIVREKVTSASVDYELIEQDGKKIARIIIYSFTENVASQFSDAMIKAQEAGVKNIIIDLRDNGGGYLEQTVKIADMFLPEGKIITTEDRKIDMLDKVYTATGEATDYKVVILINEWSASASEVLTAALVENDVAVAVGTKSFGKGTVQAMYDVPDDALMKFTVAYYLTPTGNNIHKKGITPSSVVENSAVPVDMSQFSYFNLTKTYKIGDKGAEVENAKKMLETLGIFIGEINDVYDENLKGAVNLFQQAKGLYPYGVLDITTQMSLYETLRTTKIEVDDQLQAAIDIF